MDNQTCHYISDAQSIEENKAVCEKILCTLFRMKEKLDQPLSNFMKEDIAELEKHLRSVIKTMRSLPIEILTRYMSSNEVVFQSLQNTVIELNLALYHYSLSNDKALFYRHLLSSQEVFTEIFTSGLLEVVGSINTNIPQTPTNISAKVLPNYKTISNFSQCILPELCTLFQAEGVIHPEQCEQAISDMKQLENLLERQKSLINTSPTVFFENDESAILHCKLTIALTYAEELIQKLIYLFSAFQPRYRSQSRQTVRLREEIVYYLTLFNHHYDEVLQKINEMKVSRDRARFHYQHVEPLLEGTVSSIVQR